MQECVYIRDLKFKLLIYKLTLVGYIEEAMKYELL